MIRQLATGLTRARYFATATRNHLDLANEAVSHNKPHLALSHYLESIQQHPSAEALFNAGNTYLQLDKPDQALDMYEKSIAMAPHPDTYVNMANLMFLKRNNPGSAIDLYRQAIQLHERVCGNPMSISEKLAHAEIWFNLGCVCDAGASKLPLPNEIHMALEWWDLAASAFLTASTLGIERADLLKRNVLVKRNARSFEHLKSTAKSRPLK